MVKKSVWVTAMAVALARAVDVDVKDEGMETGKIVAWIITGSLCFFLLTLVTITCICR